MSSTDAARDKLRRDFLRITEELQRSPYNLDIWLLRAALLKFRHYHDLAVGDYYKALLLVDDALDTSGEYHEQAIEAYQQYYETSLGGDGKIHADVARSLRKEALRCYMGLTECLLKLGCLYDAYRFCQLGLKTDPSSSGLKALRNDILAAGGVEFDEGEKPDVSSLPKSSYARREVYPWNGYEPDRDSDELVELLNKKLLNVSSRCVVKAVHLPVLHPASQQNGHVTETAENETVRQLGLFAKNDIEPGATVVRERSFLAVNNRLRDELCDACSVELPKDPSQSYACEDCQTTIFCSKTCRQWAMTIYHPAVCDNDAWESINKDVDMADATDALYGLLLGRAMCMAETQDMHPLELTETNFLWGDFVPWTDTTKSRASSEPPRTLPWSFEHNIAGPLHLLTTLDLDIFQCTERYDFWILNTLLAKFRGVANARMDPKTGKPEVAAVHPLWCLANHSCAPNVTWEWGGVIKMWSRDGSKGEVVRWGENAENEQDSRWRGGIRAGDEILNHYCDVRLPVKERREWAAGALGGDCMCERCLWEASHSSS